MLLSGHLNLNVSTTPSDNLASLTYVLRSRSSYIRIIPSQLGFTAQLFWRFNSSISTPNSEIQSWNKPWCQRISAISQMEYSASSHYYSIDNMLSYPSSKPIAISQNIEGDSMVQVTNTTQHSDTARGPTTPTSPSQELPFRDAGRTNLSSNGKYKHNVNVLVRLAIIKRKCI